MKQPTPEKLAEWQTRAAVKEAIVPEYFEVFPDKVILLCGNCQHQFIRPLVFGLDEPVFVCPIENCCARNWVPVKFQRT